MIYRVIFQLVFRWLPPEFAHLIGKRSLQAALRLGLIRVPKVDARIAIPQLPGIEFANRLGIAAGFDKNAELVRELFALGFGHIEIGTVTAQPQAGNPKPRLFRLVDSKSLVNRMGFNNAGADAIAQRLGKLRASGKPLPIIGVNIGKTRVVSNEAAAADYRASASLLAPHADYLAINVSSPNTPGLRELQQAEQLKPILESVAQVALGKPILIKLAPDLANDDVRDIAALATELKLAGLIVANTSLNRFGLNDSNATQDGGYSGPLLAPRAIELLSLLQKEFPNLAVISVGGVSSQADLQQRLALGAQLVQLYTAFIYQGPLLAKRWTS